MATSGETERPKTGVEALYPEAIKEIEDAILRQGQGGHENVAIISDPYAGRKDVTAYIKEHYGEKVTFWPFFSVVRERNFIASLQRPGEIILLDNCQFLALRRIGGFKMLDELLSYVSSTESQVITTWNSYSWSYLNNVREISRFFSKVIRLGPVDPSLIREYIISRHTCPTSYIDDRTVNGMTQSRRGEHLQWLSERLSGMRKAEKPAPAKPPQESEVFALVTKTARGNPGVAERIFEMGCDKEAGLFRMGSLPDAPCIVQMDINEAFLLSIILSMEEIGETDLAEIASPEIEIAPALYRLIAQGLVEEKEGTYRIRPEALACTVDYLKRIRMVW